MANVSDINNINAKQYNVYYGPYDLGLTVNESVVVELNGDYITVDDCEQYAGVVAEIEVGVVPKVTVEFMRADYTFIRDKLLVNRFETIISGSDAAMYMGNRNLKLQADYSDILRLHPTSLDTDDFSGDFYFPKSAAKIVGTQFQGSRTSTQRFSVEFTVYPDPTNPGKEYGIMGDWTLSQGTPIGVWLQSDRWAATPAKTLSALTLTPDEVDRVHAFAAYGDTTSDTLDVNFVAGYSATDKDIVFDTLTTASILMEDMTLSFSTELAFVQSIAWTDAYSGTVTLARGVMGSTAVALSDGDSFAIMDTISTENATDKATWDSDTTAAVLVGDTFQGTSITNKGAISNVAAGSSNITATVSAVSSPDLAITAS